MYRKFRRSDGVTAPRAVRRVPPPSARADDDEREQASPGDGVGLALGHFECTEDPPAQLERVINGFHPWRIHANSGCPKYHWLAPAATIRLSYATAATAIQHVDTEQARADVDRHLSEQNPGVSLVSQHVAQRRRDSPSESMPVATCRAGAGTGGGSSVDDRDLDLGAPERSGGEQSAEAGAYDRAVMPAAGRRGPSADWVFRWVHPYSRLPAHELQVHHNDRVDHRHQQQRDERGEREAADLRVAERLPERPAVHAPAGTGRAPSRRR